MSDLAPMNGPCDPPDTQHTARQLARLLYLQEALSKPNEEAYRERIQSKEEAKAP